MKKFAALALLATAAAAANAQSSVTLFGVLDMAARSVKNGDNSVKSLASGGVNTSRLGFRGSEDLGDGLRAGFWLESGLTPDNGGNSDTTRFFNRRSTLSLSGSYGELRLGRDFSPSYTGFLDFDTFGDNGVAAGSKFFNRFSTTVDTNTRADNQVQYFLPAGLGGVYGSASVAAGEATSGKKYAGGRLGYATGPVNVSLAYAQTTVTPLVAGEDKYKVATVGASYDLGLVKFNGYYSQNKFAAQKVVSYNLGASVPMGLGVLKAGYTKVDAQGTNPAGSSIDGDDANQIAVGYLYNLSKRTAVYGTVARVNNKNRAAYVVDANPVLPSPNTGRDSTGYEVGIRHSF